MTRKSGNGGRARSAITGRYVPRKYAETHPKTTVIERKQTKSQPSKGGK